MKVEFSVEFNNSKESEVQEIEIPDKKDVDEYLRKELVNWVLDRVDHWYVIKGERDHE